MLSTLNEKSGTGGHSGMCNQDQYRLGTGIRKVTSLQVMRASAARIGEG